MESWTPAFMTKSGSSLLFDRLELNEFEKQILNNPKATENDASRFFSRFPKFLFLGVGTEIQRESVLVGPDGEPVGRVDFFRRTFGSKFWDIIELKKPQLPVITGISGNHPRLSSKISAAISQAQDYRDWISENKKMQEELLKKGIRIYRPKLLVIAGRQGTEITEELLQMLVDRTNKGGTGLLTYSDIFEFAKEHYKAHGVIAMPANFKFPELNPQIAYQGTHQRRVTGISVLLPKNWLFEEGDKLTLILWPQHQAGCCVRVLPPVEMAKMMADINSMPNGNPNKVVLKRFINSESVSVRVDLRRRIHIPKELVVASAISDSAIFVGMGDRFEIWNPERHRQVQAMDEIAFREMLMKHS